MHFVTRLTEVSRIGLYDNLIDAVSSHDDGEGETNNFAVIKMPSLRVVFCFYFTFLYIESILFHMTNSKSMIILWV